MAWSHETSLDGPPSQFHGDPLVTRDLIVVGSDGHPGGHLYAFDRTSGRVRWKLALEGGVATQAFLWNDTVMSVGMNSEVVAVELATGTVRWQAEGPEEARGTYAGNPVLETGILFVPWQPGALDALDAETGTLLWRRELHSALNTSVTLFEGEVVVGTFDGELLQVDPRTGEPAGRFDPGEPGGILYGHLVPEEGCLLVLQAAGGAIDSPDLQGPFRLSCLRPNSEEVRWERQSESYWSTPRPLVFGNLVLVGRDGALEALDLRDGKVRWELPIEGVPRGLGASETHLLVGTRTGELMAFAWDSLPKAREAGRRATSRPVG